MRYSKYTITFLLLFLAGFNLQQCDQNIWSFTAPDKSEAGLIEQGKTQMNEGNYAEALDTFSKVLEQDSTNNQARYYHAKAALHASGFNSIVVGNLLTNAESQGTLPFMDLPKDSANALYQVNETIIKDLTPISNGTTTGEYTPNDINLDLTIATTARAILSFRDTNGDGAINSQDINLTFNFLNLGNLPKTMINTSDGCNPIVVHGLNALTGQQINSLITRVTRLLDQSGGLIVSYLGQQGFNAPALQNLINDVLCSAPYYYVNTGTPDNPGIGDNDHDGQIDEEQLNGLDDDGDGLFDEDTTI